MRFYFPKPLASIDAHYRPLVVSFVAAWTTVMIANPDFARLRRARDVIALLCIALICGACDSGPVVECGEDPGAVGLLRGGPWTPSKRPGGGWRSVDIRALENIAQLDGVAEDFASGQDAQHAKDAKRTIEYAAAILLFNAVEGKKAPKSVGEIVSVCGRSVRGSTARDLLEDALDLCVDGYRGVPILGCNVSLLRQALE